MGQVSPLPTPAKGASGKLGPAVAQPAAKVRPIAPARCALCGAVLEEGAQRYLVVSPQCVERTLTVCHACRNAALSEGYRPAG